MNMCSSTPQAHELYINSSLLESDLKMSKSHANVVSFDENVSHLSNFLERNEHFLWTKQLLTTKQTSTQLTRSRETKELVWPSRTTNIAWKTCVLTQALKLAGMETKKYRKCQDVCQSLLGNIYTCRVKELSRLRCNRIIKMFKKSRLSTKRMKQYTLYNTPHPSAMKNLCRSRPVPRKKILVQLPV